MEEVLCIQMSLGILELLKIGLERDEEGSVVLIHKVHLILQILVPVSGVVVIEGAIVVLSAPRISHTDEALPALFGDKSIEDSIDMILG